MPPVAEPGLASLIRAGLDSGALRFDTDERALFTVQTSSGLRSTRRWTMTIAPTSTLSSITSLMRLRDVSDGSLVLVSSQLPVGTVAELEAAGPPLPASGG